jgi:hypothetical protein
VASLLLFLLSNIVLFQPYEWDNAKVLTWVYLILSGSVAVMVVKLWRYHPAMRPVVILLLFTLTFAGALDNLRALQTKSQQLLLFSKEDINLAEKFRHSSPPGAIVLAATFHDNWVAALTGRQILSGYLGWMWTYGFKYGARVEDMKDMYRGGELAEQLFRRYQVDYLVVGPKELSEFSVNQSYFDATHPVILENDTTKIYQVLH